MGFLFLVVRSRLPPASSRLSYSHTATHIQLAHTRTTCSHRTCSHVTCSHTICSHTHALTHTHNLLTHNLLTHTQLTHRQLAHTQLSNKHNLLTHTHTTACSYTALTHKLYPHTHNLLTHTQLTHTQLLNTTQYSHTHTTCSHRTLIHTTLTHTQPTLSLTHTLTTSTQNHTQHAHTQLARLGPVVAAALCVALATSAFTLRRRRWRLAISMCILRGKRGTRPSLPRSRRGTQRRWAGSGGALGSQLTPWTPRLFVWQAWHLATSTCDIDRALLCGRHCTYGAGLALVVRLGRVVAAADCVAGVALGDSDRRFAWQAWRLATSTCILRGRRGAYGTGWLWWRAWVRWSPRRFSWQALFMAWGMFCVRPHKNPYTRTTHVNKYRHTNKSFTHQSFIHTFHPLMSLFLPTFPIPSSPLFSVIYWKKLTCGVLRPLNFG